MRLHHARLPEPAVAVAVDVAPIGHVWILQEKGVIMKKLLLHLHGIIVKRVVPADLVCPPAKEAKVDSLVGHRLRLGVLGRSRIRKKK